MADRNESQRRLTALAYHHAMLRAGIPSTLDRAAGTFVSAVSDTSTVFDAEVLLESTDEPTHVSKDVDNAKDR